MTRPLRPLKWSLGVLVFSAWVHDDAALAALPFFTRLQPAVTRRRSLKESSSSDSGTTTPSNDNESTLPPTTTTTASHDPSHATNTLTANTSSARPERGKLLPDPMDEQDLYKAYAEIQSDYQSKAFGPSSSKKWKVLNSKHNVTVSILEHADDPTCPYVKMQGIIPVPVQDCWNFLRISEWDRNMPTMDPFYEGVTVYGGEYALAMPRNNNMHDSSSAQQQQQQSAPLWRRRRGWQLHHPGNHAVRMTLCRKRMSRLLAFGKRDLVFLSVSEGSFVSWLPCCGLCFCAEDGPVLGIKQYIPYARTHAIILLLLLLQTNPWRMGRWFQEPCRSERPSYRAFQATRGPFKIRLPFTSPSRMAQPRTYSTPKRSYRISVCVWKVKRNNVRLANV
jgi:hypothetical protein